MLCGNCGKEIANGAATCPHCDFSFSGNHGGNKQARKRVVFKWTLASYIGAVLVIISLAGFAAHFAIGRYFPSLFSQSAMGGNLEAFIYVFFVLLLFFGINYRLKLGKNARAMLAGAASGTIVWLLIRAHIGNLSIAISILVGILVSFVSSRGGASRRHKALRTASSDSARHRPFIIFLRVFFSSIVVLGIYMMYSGFAWISLAIESESWPVSEGVVQKSYVESSLSTTSSSSAIPIQNRQTYTSVLHSEVISYQFHVDGKKYFGNKLTLSPKSQSGDSAYAQALVRQYPEGSVVKVHYRPGDPTFSVIQPGIAEGAWFLPSFGAVAFMLGIMLLYFSRNISV